MPTTIPPTVCDCGHAPTPDGCAAGYGLDRSGFTRCYPCSNAHELEAFNATPPRGTYLAYLSGDGAAITTWPGGTLAHVTRERKTRVSPSTVGVHVWARGTDGATWYGRGSGRGMSIRMHRAAS